MLKKTDYSEIAERYDGNSIRLEGESDEILLEYLKESHKEKFKILDLACGTGNYLKTQFDLLKGFKIKWNGLDLSPEMLRIARKKLPNQISIKEGDAENLPYEDDIFDIIINNFAYHHFLNKEAAFKESYRCLRKNGLFKIRDIDPYSMRDWWVYKYFPPTWEEDLKRFIPKTKLAQQLNKLELDVKVMLDGRGRQRKLSEVISEAENRDISELRIINEEEFNSGLNFLRSTYNKKGDITIKEYYSYVTFFCIKK